MKEALRQRLIHLVGSRRWPSGRYVTARERRMLAAFLLEAFGDR